MFPPGWWKRLKWSPRVGMDHLARRPRKTARWRPSLEELEARVVPAGTLDWAFGAGASGNFALGVAVATDQAGNVYIAGQFNDVIDADPGLGTVNVGTSSGHALFVGKYTSSGTLVWARGLSGDGNVGDFASGIAVDGAGNVCFTGIFSGTIDFDPGAGVSSRTATGLADLYVAKLDSAGNFVWASTFPGSSGSINIAYALALDSVGNVYTTGAFGQTVDFDPGSATFNVTAGSQGSAYVSKLDSNGNFAWARALAGNGSSSGQGIGVDSSGNVYSTGSFDGVVDFDPGSGTTNIDGGSGAPYISKLDTNGSFAWASMLGTDGDGWAVAVDSATGDALVTGGTSAGPFVARMNSSGVTVWRQQFAGTGSGYAISLDRSGNVFTTGFFSAATDFDPGAGDVSLTPVGDDDVYVSQLSGSGQFLSVNQLGGAGKDVGQAISVDGAGNIDVVGYFSDTADFDPGPGMANQTALGLTDLFAAQIRVGPGVVISQTGGSTDVTEGSGTDSYTVALTGQPSTNVTISLNGGSQVNVAPTSLVFTSSNWSSPQTVSVSAIDDNVPEGTHTGTITHSITTTDSAFASVTVADVTVHITDNDAQVVGVAIVQSGGTTDVAEGGNGDSYTLFLTSQPTADVTIALNGGSQLTVAPTSLVFTSGNWNSPRTVTVNAIDDTAIEGTHAGTVLHTITTTDTDYAALTAPGLTVTITDNDMPTLGVIVNETAGSTAVAEGGAGDTYSLNLTVAPTGNVTIALHASSRLNASPTSIVFTPTNWSNPQTVTVTAVDDNIVEGTQVVSITHSATSSDARYANIVVQNVAVSITDNDSPAVLFTPASGSISVAEGDSVTYSVRLNGQPGVDVTLTLNVGPGISAAPAALVFTHDDWSLPHVVTVTALDDMLPNRGRDVLIAHSVSTSDTVFAGVTAADMNVHVIDDETTLVIKGSDRSDVLTVMFSANHIQAVVNGKSTFYAPNLEQLLISTSAGNDSIKLINPTVPVVISSGGGNDTLTIEGSVLSNTFQVDASSVTLNGIAIEVVNVEAVILKGKAGSDDFRIDAVPGFGLNLQGGPGSDRLLGPDQANTWRVTGPASGSLDSTVLFTAIEDLTGGSGDDTFLFAAGKSVSGAVDGGGGSNTLDLSSYKTPVTANLQTGTVTGAKSFRNISTIAGGAGSDKLIGPDQSNIWDLTASNAGTVGSIAFRSFENLTGGGSADGFVLSAGVSLKGRIDGGGGSDTLDYSALAMSVTVNLQAKSATSTGGWLNLEHFLGGLGMNSLIAPNKVNSWSLTGTGMGTVTGGFGFQAFQNLTGGNLADLFDLTAGGDWTGLLNGGAGIDTLLTSGGVYNLTGSHAGTVNGHRFANVENRS